MFRVSMPELIFAILFGGIPVAAGIWVIYTLVHIRSSQRQMLGKLEAIARAIAKQP